MKVKVFDDHFTHETVEIPLSFLEWIHLKINGKVYVYHSLKKGWKTRQPFYIVYCKRHGYYLDYPNGHKQHFLCGKCWREEKTRQLQERLWSYQYTPSLKWLTENVGKQ